MCNSALQEFDAYIQDALVNPDYTPSQRRQLLINWEQASSTPFPEMGISIAAQTAVVLPLHPADAY